MFFYTNTTLQNCREYDDGDSELLPSRTRDIHHSRQPPKVFKQMFESGDFDMVVHDIKNDTCVVYEIKHSDQCVCNQAQLPMNENMINVTALRSGTLTGRFILYLGDDLDADEGVAYRNAEQFLNDLSNIDNCS